MRVAKEENNKHGLRARHIEPELAAVGRLQALRGEGDELVMEPGAALRTRREGRGGDDGEG